MGSISGSGRSAGGGHSSPSQRSCLENPMERGAQWAIVHRVAESDMAEATWKACTGMEETAMKIVGENPDPRNLEVICIHIAPYTCLSFSYGKISERNQCSGP